MTDLQDLLRATAAQGSDAVDLAEDAVADRIRHRRTRTRRLTLGATTLAAAAVIAGTAWAVHPGPQTPTATGPSAPAVPPRIVTSDVDNLSGMEAALPTTLTADANGCVRPGHSNTTLVWPRGYTVRGTPDSFEILDAEGKPVAHSGAPLTIGGGGADRFQNTWAGRECATGGHLWMVGGISARR
ncbi:hypothetical protein [Kribbella sp. NPDC000426]|uniref:hypothetical protein n=1 Tax=Kribbella sp. NPDC000426 TaxID=3154255 RepID=UPI003330E575